MSDVGTLSRTTRNLGPSLFVIATTSVVSLVVLYLWRTTPTPTSPQGPTVSAHGAHAVDTGAVTRPIIFLAAWMLMTAAMMLPSAMPLLASLDRMTRHRSTWRTLPLFAALAYLSVWGLVGVAALAVNALVDAHLLRHTSSQVDSRLAGGGLVLAGLYGLSPLARSCLRACRRPFGFLARHWRGGPGVRLQAARIGAAYGVSCVGCCVPMIGIMFVVGMSNIAIVVALGVVMVVMKSSAVGTRVAQVLSIALVVAGVAVGLEWLQLMPHQH
jgi:predicted metal-binding membrane protein